MQYATFSVTILLNSLSTNTTLLPEISSVYKFAKKKMEPHQKFHLKTLVAIVSQFVSLIYNYIHVPKIHVYKDFFCVNKICVLRRARQKKNRRNILLVYRQVCPVVRWTWFFFRPYIRTRTCALVEMKQRHLYYNLIGHCVEA